MDDSKYIGGTKLSQTSAYIRKIGGAELSQTSAYIRKIEYLDPDWLKRDYDFENFIHGVFNHGSTVGRVINEPPSHFGDHKAGEE